jgi:hypothetical protein
LPSYYNYQDHPVAVFGYPEDKKNVTEFLNRFETDEPSKLVLGHFGVKGCMTESGNPYAFWDAVDLSEVAFLERRVWKFMLGHVHSGTMGSTYSLVSYIGLALEHSWEVKAGVSGSMMLLDGDGMRRLSSCGPVFIDMTLDEWMSSNRQVDQGTFFKLRCRPDQLDEAEMVRGSNIGVRTHIFVEDAVSGVEASRLRTEGVYNAVKATTMEDAAKGYVSYCCGKSTLPASEDEVLRVARAKKLIE